MPEHPGVVDRILAAATNQWDDDEPTDAQIERATDQLTDTQADREYSEDADRAADRYERELDARWER